MPRTRSEQSREEKVATITDLAVRRLRGGGYEALSVAAIARELGLAQNALYWYFPSKDHLFVAALERMLGDIGRRKQTAGADKVERILWFTDQYQELFDLRGAIGERASKATVVAEFSGRLDVLLSRMISNALRDSVAEEDLELAAETFRATAEGAFAKNMSPAQRRRVLSFTLERLLSDP
jgi:AcrR family transcriptional regulator